MKKISITIIKDSQVLTFHYKTNQANKSSLVITRNKINSFSRHIWSVNFKQTLQPFESQACIRGPMLQSSKKEFK